MIKVYTPVAPIDIFVEWFGNDVNFQRCDNFNEVVAQEIKIACVPMYFNLNGYEFDYHQFDLLLISDIEFNHLRPVQQWLETSDIKNYLVALGGLEGYTASGDFTYRPWWTFNLMNKNTYTPSPDYPKPYVYDALLGAKKPHRDFIMAKLHNSDLADKSIVNYRSVFHAPESTDQEIQQYLQQNDLTYPYPYLSKNLDPAWEVSDNITYQISDQVPWGIYKQTYYSIIPETVYERVFFFSEKPAKVLLAKRLFVVFSSQHYLQNMRNILGFKTFDGIIDESYDLEPNKIIRFNMAFEQLQWLLTQDHQLIQHKSKEIREHNHRRLFELKQESLATMKAMVYNKLEEIKNVNSLQ